MEKPVFHEVTSEEKDLLYKLFKSNSYAYKKRSRTEKVYSYIRKHLTFRPDNQASGK